MGLEFEDNFFLQQLFRVVNFLVYRVRSPVAVSGHLHTYPCQCVTCFASACEWVECKANPFSVLSMLVKETTCGSQQLAPSQLG